MQLEKHLIREDSRNIMTDINDRLDISNKILQNCSSEFKIFASLNQRFSREIYNYSL